MSKVSVQFRVDKELKDQTEQLLDELGMDLSTYLKMCMVRLNIEQGVPFKLTLTEEQWNRLAHTRYPDHEEDKQK